MYENFEIKEETVDVYGYKCQSCGNNLQYKPQTSSLECPYCGYTKEIENISSVTEQVLMNTDFQEAEKEDTLHVFRCASCGAVSETLSDSVSFLCPYCNKTNLLEDTSLKGIRPTGIIPFAVTKSEAKYEFGKNLKKGLFTPSIVKKRDNIVNISGVYLPCWTFDCSTISNYDGVLGEYRTRTVGSGKNRRTETYVHYFNVSGTYSQGFDDISIQASSRVESKFYNKVYNYDTNNAMAHNNAYLAGYFCDHYTTDLKEAYQIARNSIDEALKEGIKNEYGADLISHLNLYTDVQNISYKYLLVPMYLGTFEFKSKVYNLVMNGVTKIMSGKKPLSGWKIFFFVLGLLGVAFGGAMLWLYLSGGSFPGLPS